MKTENIIEKIADSIALSMIRSVQFFSKRKNLMRLSQKGVAYLLIFSFITSWAYNLVPIPGIEKYSPEVKTAMAASAWSIRQEINVTDGYFGAPTAAYAKPTDTWDKVGTLPLDALLVAAGAQAEHELASSLSL